VPVRSEGYTPANGFGQNKSDDQATTPSHHSVLPPTPAIDTTTDDISPTPTTTTESASVPAPSNQTQKKPVIKKWYQKPAYRMLLASALGGSLLTAATGSQIAKAGDQSLLNKDSWKEHWNSPASIRETFKNPLAQTAIIALAIEGLIELGSLLDQETK
jgi:hypothetical protein